MARAMADGACHMEDRASDYDDVLAMLAHDLENPLNTILLGIKRYEETRVFGSGSQPQRRRARDDLLSRIARGFPPTDMRSSLVLILSTVMLTALGPGCSKKKSEPPAATTTPPPPSQPATPAAALSDPQIAAIVVAANQVDIDAGQLALKKSKNAEVKKFAERMVTDHTAVNKAAVELVTKLGVTPEPTDASRGLTSGGADTRAKLEALDGDAFDRAYVDNEVAYHKAVITVLDGQLIPAASNAELKSTLVGVRPAFDAHLKHAEQMQAALAGGKPADHGAHGK